MNTQIATRVALLSLTLAWISTAPSAQASLDACGGVYVYADADCEFRPTEECTTSCETVAVETSCAAKIYTECESGCTASASAECTTTCEETCTPTCVQAAAMETEEPPDCEALCRTDCEQGCSDRCDNSDRRGPCGACCSHTCDDKCEEQCKNQPPVPVEAPDAGETVCTPTCTSVCTGSCTAQANTECQIDCQTELYTECETELVEQCKTECETTGGAIFCNGQFLNSADIDACAEQLATEIDIHVEVEVRASGSVCTGSACDDDNGPVDDVEESLGCAMTSPGSTGTGRQALALFGLFALGAVGLGRRRNRR